MQKHKETIVTCVVTLGSTLLAEEFSNLTAKLVFIVLSIVAVSAFFRGDEEGKRGIKYFSFFLTTALAVFVTVDGIFPELPSRFLSWSRQAAQSEDVESALKDIYQTNLNHVNQSLGKLQDDVGQVSTALTELDGLLETEKPLFSKTYPSEVEELLKVLDGEAEVIKEHFPDITLDAKAIELFYKTRLYDKVYHYSSFISAFEQYGIPCGSLDVYEYTLALWDTENLYIFYNMKKELEPDLAENKQYEEKELLFNPNKVELNQYSDILDYGNWHFTYHEKDARELEKIIGNYIMNFYKRFHLNFTR